MSMPTLLDGGEVVALGWTLLHFLWQSTAIAMIYALIDRCTRRASANVRYGIALCALALLPMTAIATYVEQSRLVSQVRMDEHAFTVSQLGAIHTALIEQVPMAAPAVGNSELWIAEHAAQLMPWMDCLWLAGVVFLSVRAVGGWWQLRLLRQRAQPAVPQLLHLTFRSLVHRYQLTGRVVLRVSEEIVSPMVFGIWRTVVLVPLSAALSLPPEQLEAVLAHELAHVRRWDYLFNLLQTSVECLFFFQPAVWWISRRTREFREVCCDEVATRACADPTVYAEALLHMEEHRVQHKLLAVALQGNGGTLLNRIRRVMGETAMEQTSMSGMRMVAVGMVLAGLYLAPHIAHGMRSHDTQVMPVAEPAAVERDEQPQLLAEAAAPAANPHPTRIAMATPQPAPETMAAVTPAPQPRPEPSESAVQTASSQRGSEYLQKMREAGYPLDLNKDLDMIVSLRSVGVTPEYAKSMAHSG